MNIRISWFYLLISLLLVGCPAPAGDPVTTVPLPPPIQWKRMGTPVGDLILKTHVSNVLHLTGIESKSEGDSLYSYILVPKDDYEKAVRAIESKGVTIETNLLTISKEPGEWQSKLSQETGRWIELNTPYKEALLRDDLSESTVLGKALRIPSIKKTAAECPFLYAISYKTRSYMGADGETKTGYGISVSLKNPKIKGVTVNFQTLKGEIPVMTISYSQDLTIPNPNGCGWYVGPLPKELEKGR